MRTSDTIAIAAAAGLGLATLLAPTPGFVQSRSQGLAGQAAIAIVPTPAEAFRLGTQLLREGRTAEGVSSLQSAADRGHLTAMWRLARMHADGDGVPLDHMRAFELYSRIASQHADDDPASPQARIVAASIVALGRYHAEGIPNSQVRQNRARARELYTYAATYFRDPDAQFELARMFLNGSGASRDPRQAAKWLNLAAEKGHREAQASLGDMLFAGRDLRRQAALGLMWLTVARDQAGEGDDRWIVDRYEQAFSQASDEERALALVFLERWLRQRRD